MFEQLSQVIRLQLEQTSHCGIDAKCQRPLLTNASRLFFPLVQDYPQVKQTIFPLAIHIPYKNNY